jgi:hypothetical protein
MGIVLGKTQYGQGDLDYKFTLNNNEEPGVTTGYNILLFKKSTVEGQPDVTTYSFLYV